MECGLTPRWSGRVVNNVPSSCDGALIDTVRLEKSWHAIHFLLSGTADAGEDPSQFMLSGVPMPGARDCEVLQNPTDKVRRFAAEQYLNDLREFTSRHARNGYDFLVVIA